MMKKSNQIIIVNTSTTTANLNIYDRFEKEVDVPHFFVVQIISTVHIEMATDSNIEMNRTLVSIEPHARINYKANTMRAICPTTMYNHATFF